ncbi:MAG: hypothetical protein ACHQHN_05685 [Sphingobacteriales bacterium]
MPRHKVLITVTTYPQPSRSHDELVCTAGILESGEWIRIYPIPLSFLIDLKGNGKVNNVKYTWFELELRKRTDDFRPESHSPVNYNFKDLQILARIDTENNWRERKTLVLKNVYTNMGKLIADSKSPKNVSLATFKPTTIVKLDWEEEKSRDWKSEWTDLRKQGDLFAGVKDPGKLIRKLPYKFFYIFTDETGKERRLMIEDWEIGALYWKCLRAAEGNEQVALQKVKEQYEDNFKKDKDVYFFLGTTKSWHKRAKNPFMIIGIFYPKKEVVKGGVQVELF